jgi:hypothetical protein
MLAFGLRPRRWLLDEHPDPTFFPQTRNTFETPERRQLLLDYVAMSLSGTDDPVVAKRRDAQVVAWPVVAYTLDTRQGDDSGVVPGSFWVHESDTRGDIDLTVGRRSTDVSDLPRWLRSAGRQSPHRHEIWIHRGVPVHFISHLRLKPNARRILPKEIAEVERLAASLQIVIEEF